jgi:hypothetical protein
MEKNMKETNFGGGKRIMVSMIMIRASCQGVKYGKKRAQRKQLAIFKTKSPQAK